jgi:hypothetical protein
LERDQIPRAGLQPQWGDAADEDSQAKPFWIAFFEIFGITDKRVATFELNVKKLGTAHGFVDLFWPGMLLVEHKSRGKDLDAAFQQALDYFPACPSATCRSSSSCATSRAFACTAWPPERRSNSP